MVTRRLVWAAAGVLLVLSGCEGPRVGTDGGDDEDGADACEGLTLCATAGTSCEGDSIVTCAANADGCLVETSTACGADQTCDDSGATAECVDEVDPCDAIPAEDRCDTANARACDGDTLTICTANADGCLVLEETDCAASPGGVCDESGTMPVCALPVDPCEGVADACTTPGTSCDGTNLVTCAPNAFGCLVETTADCASRAGGTCDDTATAECTFTGDPCDGVTQCAAAGVSCDGPELVACAEDAFGCLVETRTDCTDTMFGFCDAEGAPVACSTAATDPCMGETECGTEPSRACSADETSIEACAPNAFGCFVAETTSCADTSEVCSDASGLPACVDPCTLVDTCPSATYCDGDDVVTCAADTNGCLIESGRTTCPGVETCDATTNACADLCPTAETVILDCASGTVSGDTADGTASISDYECTTYEYVSNEQVWRFENPARMAVTIRSTRLASSGDFDLYVLDGSAACGAAATCLGSSTGTTATETVEFIAEPGVTSYVAYDRFGDTAGASTGYTLDITCEPIVCGDGNVAGDEACDDGNTADTDGCSATCTIEPTYGCGGEPSVCYVAGTNGTCATAAVVTGNVARDGEDLADGGARPMDSSCGGGSGAAALYYNVTVPAGTRVDVTTTKASGGPDLVVFAQDACSDTTCTRATDSPESLSFLNTGATDFTTIVGVRGYSSSTTGTFDIAFRQTALAANATCSAATDLTANLTGEVLSTGGPRPTGTNCGSSTGPVRYYAVSVPPNSSTSVTATSTGSPAWDLTLRTLADCSGACIASRDASSSAAETVSFTNTTGTALTRLVAVGADSSTVFGTYDLAIATTPITYALNATCATATAIGTATPSATAQDTAGGGTSPAGATCGSSGTQTLFYSITVPAGQIATVEVDGGASFDAVVMELESCGATDCLDSTDGPGDGGVEAVVIDNSAGTSDAVRIIAVNEFVAGETGTFDLDVSYVTPAPNGTCAGATAIGTATSSLTGEDTAVGGPAPSGTDCRSGAAPTLYYALTVPAGQIATVEVDGATGLDAVVMELDSCSATACLDSTDDTADGGVETVAVSNAGGTTDLVRYLAVRHYTAGSAGVFDLDVTFSSPPANTTCATATAISSATALTGVSTEFGGPFPTGSSCGFGGASPALYYAITVPAGETATVSADGATGFDTYVMELDSCGATDCLDYADDTGGGGVESVVIDNSAGTASLTRIIVVNEYTDDEVGVFDLSVTYAP